MASVTKETKVGRVGWRIRFYLDDRRKEIYLAVGGKRGESMAQKIASHVDNLAQSKANNVPGDPSAVAWANGTEGRLRENLVAWGLADPVNQRLFTDQGKFLESFCQSYIDSRSDLSKSSIDNWNQVRNCLVEYFGPKKILSSITPGDADRWKRWLSSERGLAQATIAKLVKRSKQLFKEAVKDRLLKENPFEGLKIGSEANPSRMRFIDKTMAEKILAACPNADWRSIFGLSRFCGLRCPSEVLNLKWSDVDWESGKLRIDAKKTGLRFCPIFPEVREILSEAFDMAPDGAIYVVNGYRAEQSLRTQFARILQRAGLEQWPKIFHNLRSSCRTELQDHFPSHVCDEWLGHSTRVAERHYLQTTDDHWAAAIESCPPIRPPKSNNQEPSAASTGNKKTRKNAGFEGSGSFLMGVIAPPGGLEPNENNREIIDFIDSVPPLVPPSPTIHPDFNELVMIWHYLGQMERANLIFCAREIARCSEDSKT